MCIRRETWEKARQCTSIVYLMVICYFSMTVEGHVLDPIIVLIVMMDFIPMDLIVKVSITYCYLVEESEAVVIVW
jgi:hypothetical protein